MINKNIVIGKICSAHGVRGELKIYPITDNVRRFSKLKKCFLVKEDNTVIKELTVKSTRVDKEYVLIHFDGVDDRDEAMKLKGNYIAVDRDDAVKLPKDTYFIADLLGIKVIDDSLGELGNINDVYEIGCELQKKRIEWAIMLKVAESYEEDADDSSIEE